MAGRMAKRVAGHRGESWKMRKLPAAGKWHQGEVAMPGQKGTSGLRSSSAAKESPGGLGEREAYHCGGMEVLSLCSR